MKTITVLIEIPDDKADDGFIEILEGFSEQILEANKETLTVRLLDKGDHG